MNEERHPELCRILSEHAARYPLMAPCDAVKLIFQNEFGGEHLISEPNATLAWLRAERASTPDDPSVPPVEDIGNGMVRVYLPRLEFTETALRTLNRGLLPLRGGSPGLAQGLSEQAGHAARPDRAGYICLQQSGAGELFRALYQHGVLPPVPQSRLPHGLPPGLPGGKGCGLRGGAVGGVGVPPGRGRPVHRRH